MFSHVTVGVSDFETSFAFYSRLLPLPGLELKFREDDRPWAGWKTPDAERPLFVINAPFDGDAAYQAVLAAGAVSEGEPGLRPEYHAHYYGAYFRDPDGNRLCVCTHGVN